MRSRNTRWRKYVSAAMAVLILICVPAAAHAAFRSSSQGSQAVTAGIMAPPASASVAMTCENRFLWWARSRITVSSFAAVSRANYYDVKLYDPSGNLEHTGDLSTAAGKTYTSQLQLIGTWSYEIRAHYKVPGSTNTWTGQPLRGTLTCA
ncbi:MAG: hypothetical protein JWQ75_2601 [Pseudarthrobacter sp.]|nr:hypothetical protein [Pseudarthrobacter sp.]